MANGNATLRRILAAPALVEKWRFPRAGSDEEIGTISQQEEVVSGQSSVVSQSALPADR